MNRTIDIPGFRERLKSFAPESHAQERLLALYSAAISLADEEALSAALLQARRLQVPRAALYEIVLQSYLFLGFPRMLVAVEHLERHYKQDVKPPALQSVSGEEVGDWFLRGVALCRRVYADNYERLKHRVEAMAPEIFQWMVFEGYGKVLSRPGLHIATRELAIIACLTLEHRPPQLFSHIKGALHVGAAPELILQVIEDIGDSGGDGYGTALQIFRQLHSVS